MVIVGRVIIRAAHGRHDQRCDNNINSDSDSSYHNGMITASMQTERVELWLLSAGRRVVRWLLFSRSLCQCAMSNASENNKTVGMCAHNSFAPFDWQLSLTFAVCLMFWPGLFLSVVFWVDMKSVCILLIFNTWRDIVVEVRAIKNYPSVRFYDAKYYIVY